MTACPQHRVRGPALAGVGVAGTLDQVVFHQLLHWHHFYDRTANLREERTADLGLITDGIFHGLSTAALVAGLYLIWAARDQGAPDPTELWGPLLLGAGGFNLFDGIVQHKILRLHQVREEVGADLPYDAAFIGLSLVVLLAGLALTRARPARAR